MARTKGPLMSLEARGAIAESLIFQNQKGRSVCKHFAKPKNPNSAAQQLYRSYFSQCCAFWQLLAPDEIAAWAAATTPRLTTAKAVFMSANLKQLKSELGLLRMPGILEYGDGMASYEGEPPASSDYWGYWFPLAPINGKQAYSHIAGFAYKMYWKPELNCWVISDSAGYVSEDHYEGGLRIRGIYTGFGAEAGKQLIVE